MDAPIEALQGLANAAAEAAAVPSVAPRYYYTQCFSFPKNGLN